MAGHTTHLQDHHAIEQQTLKHSPLLAKLQEAGRFNIHAQENRLFLPASPAYADAMGITPHSGGPLGEYQSGMIRRLNEIQRTRDGKAALLNDPEALDRVLARVEALRDTVKVGLVNGDLYTNTPVGSTPAITNQRIRDFIDGVPEYHQKHIAQIQALRGLTGVDLGWMAVTHSESGIVTTLNQIEYDPKPPTRGGNIELQRSGLSLAISNVHHGGRLVLAEPSILTVERVLGEAAGQRIRLPWNQQGMASLDLLLGEASTSQLIRSGGLLASGADVVITARRTSQLLEEGNGTAAQSELTHALARNGGGWIGGMATASVIGTSSFVPAAIVAGDALLMSKAFDKGADLLDNRAVYRQTDKADVTWQFNGLNWQRQAVMDSAGDGSGNPAERSVGASYEKARELGAYAHAKAVELALGNAPPPQDPFSIPAREGEGRLDNPNWHRDAQTEQWTRQVKVGVSGVNDRGVYETQTASPERANELNREAVQRIENNIANGKAAIAASYLETRAATRASDFVPLVPEVVEQARARSDAVLGSDNQRYQRDEAGQWTRAGQTAQGNMALELELTRTIQQPSLERFNETIAALEARPLPSAAEMNQNELRHSYYAAGIALTPVWEQAIELATTRTREQHGITGPTIQELGPSVAGNAGESRPITHYQVGPDGVARAVATTTTVELQAAWSEVRARAAEQAPVPESPELRIAALSPREREAYQQALQEANRQGAATVDAGQVARTAAQHVQSDAPAPSDARDAVADAQREEALHRPPTATEPAAATPPSLVVPVSIPEPETPERARHAEQREQPPRREPEVQTLPPEPEPRVADIPLPAQTATSAVAPAVAAEPLKQEAPGQGASHEAVVDATPTRAAEPLTATHVSEQAVEIPDVSSLNSAIQPLEPRPEPVPEQAPLVAEHSSPAEPVELRTPDPEAQMQSPAAHANPHAESERPDLLPQESKLDSSIEPVAEPARHQADVSVPDVDDAPLPRDPRSDPTQPGHPDHALYQQIREGVEALDARHGRSFDEVSERVTASLLVLAKDNDLERVDHVLVSNATREHPAGHTLFVVQGEPSDPAHHRAATPTELAAQTSVEESMQQFDAVSREAQKRAIANQMEQQLEDQRVQHEIQIRAASGGG
ncbi:XVIPCD domain-containing protein [Stenotrophomonas indicatrix]|uniref:XVIPCD domain-containing protein n=1 Tax=Stenotrophomonas indicatrix TaxID=2045451 RepID=UPI000FD7DA4E|nr:XVIPCD domain-containing protein [Stenotrophomonas indicatrix]